MDVSADETATTRTHPYQFVATAILGVEPYQPAPLVPEWANVRRTRALVRALLTKVPDRKPASWNPWLNDVAERWPVTLALDSYSIRNVPERYRYEVGRTFVLCVFVAAHEHARTIATEYFEVGTGTGLFESYTIESVEQDATASTPTERHNTYCLSGTEADIETA